MDKAVLLGLFDGVHIGHAAALEALCKTGAKEKLVYTFRSAELDTKGERKLLLTDSEKEEKLLSLGADRVIFADFNSVRELTAEEFVCGVLSEELHAEAVVCGENFRFGRGAAAGKTELEELLGARLICVPTVFRGGEPVSTTRIRGLLETGRIKEANALLGYRYFVRGRVVHGNSFGRRMGIRTINTACSPLKLIPADGVYSSDAIIDGRRYLSVTDIGVKPTVCDGAQRGVETHILEFDADIYDTTASIIFNDFYREEKKFDSTAELIDQINRDINRRREEG